MYAFRPRATGPAVFAVGTSIARPRINALAPRFCHPERSDRRERSRRILKTSRPHRRNAAKELPRAPVRAAPSDAALRSRSGSSLGEGDGKRDQRERLTEGGKNLISSANSATEAGLLPSLRLAVAFAPAIHRLACGLGQVAALTAHRAVIHYRALRFATSSEGGSPAKPQRA